VKPSARRLLTGPGPAAVLALACFANTLSSEFVYDDTHIVRDNTNIRDLSDWRAVWLTEWWAQRDGRPNPDPQHDRLYRPLTLFTFALNYAADSPEADGRPRPRGFHAVNILLHALATLLVWRVVERLAADRAVAAWTALLFAVHPVHAEAVAGIVGRAEILTTIFLLAALLWSSAPGAGRAMASGACLLAALLSKESAVCGVVLIPLVAYWTKPGRPRTQWWWLGPLLAALLPLLIYVPLRWAALGGQLIRTSGINPLLNPLVEGDLGGRLVGALTILGHYARMLAAPLHPSCDYSDRVIVPGRFDAMTAAGIAALLIWLAALAMLRRRDPRQQAVGLFALLFAAGYALISNTVLLIGVPAAERFLYFPSAAALAGVVCAVVSAARTPRARRTAGAAGLVAVVLLAARSVVRNEDWRDSRVLFERDLANWPQSIVLRQHLARAHLNAAEKLRDTEPCAARREYAAADRLLELALRDRARNPDALFLRGLARHGLLDWDTALIVARNALLLNPDEPGPRQLVQYLAANRPEPEARLAELQSEAQRCPGDGVVHLRLAELHLQAGRSAEAATAVGRALELMPESTEALRLAAGIRAPHDPAGAIRIVRALIEADPRDWQAHLQLAGLLAPSDPVRALQSAFAAERIQPDEIVTTQMVAELLLANGRVGEALERYRRLAAEISPDDPERAGIVERITEIERELRNPAPVVDQP
jgi:tetratricopeptide (TPR) repeat protein